MDFWDEFSKTLNNVAESTVKGAEKLTGIAKLKYMIYTEQNKLENVYQNMGKLYFEDCEGNLPTLKVQRGIAEELIARIDRLKAELADAMNSAVCDKCGEKVNKDMSFCPKCGAKLTREENNNDDINKL